ncbi:DUF4229 domain-containing protein [Saxibacter everestensis]|uniref:DUF4229 domain-containing protein n=1 Tax=Saxibacter everestensis TaxID=2909229 RepID=A0ABY8QQ55_9MICO|nr:DUF4229 domain-containing protein [Brevibacteriaceae bacterium ZFBP1038]
MNAVVKYSLLRLGIFFLAFGALWVAGFNELVSLVLATVIAVLLSFLLLRRQRDDVVKYVQERSARRAEQRRTKVDRDSAYEDDIVDRADHPDDPDDNQR